MKCTTCGTEYDFEFIYCPKCGKKAINIRREKKSLSNTDWLAVATREELKQTHDMLKTMSFDEFEAWLKDKHDNIYIFRCFVSLIEPGSKYATRLRYGSVDEMVESIEAAVTNKNYKRKVVAFCPRESKLLKTTPMDEEGITWWRSKEGCLAALDEIRTKLRGRGISL
jgi:late competence protein required for DNA uptake (superfamily II DNA/RNA helicase)